MDWADILQGRPEPQALMDYLQKKGVTHEMLAEQVMLPEGDKPYGRKVLYESELGEVLLVSWSLENFSALHDHGSGSGLICFFKGECLEEYWDWDAASGLRFRDKVKRVAGDVCVVQEKEIHRVKAISEGALSLHFYIPSSGGMRVFDPSNSCYHVVTDDCGAWAPEREQIKKTVQW